jgi:hypothetical protein
MSMKALAFPVALACVGLPSCGPSPEAGGGIGGTGTVTVSSVSSGVVTKLSSVNLSGTAYDDSNALYCLDDEPCTSENRLKLGMVVLVRGRVQSPFQGVVTRVADTITFNASVEGDVQSVAPDGTNLVILGQFVEVNEHTVIDEEIQDKSTRNIQPGDAIVVSGFVAADGHIVATLIMKSSGMPHYEVEGVIRNHDVEGKRLKIGQLDVDYTAADLSQMPAGDTMSWNDRLVHVRGDEWQLRSKVPDVATLRATRIRSLSLRVADSAEAKLQGFITQLNPSGEILVNNHPIKVSSATKFEGGTEEELLLGKHVFIHGTLIQGVLEANEIIFK